MTAQLKKEKNKLICVVEPNQCYTPAILEQIARNNRKTAYYHDGKFYTTPVAYSMLFYEGEVTTRLFGLSFQLDEIDLDLDFKFLKKIIKEEQK